MHAGEYCIRLLCCLACVLFLHGQLEAVMAQTSQGQYQLHSVTLETTKREDTMQIACGPASVQSHARITLQLGSTVVALRQEDTTACSGLWAPVWAAQQMRLQWVLQDPIYFDAGAHSIAMSDADRIYGPRKRVMSHYSFRDNGSNQAVFMIPEGYALTLNYSVVGGAMAYPGLLSMKDQGAQCRSKGSASIMGGDPRYANKSCPTDRPHRSY
jgi:hypothetical protein